MSQTEAESLSISQFEDVLKDDPSLAVQEPDATPRPRGDSVWPLALVTMLITCALAGFMSFTLLGGEAGLDVVTVAGLDRDGNASRIMAMQDEGASLDVLLSGSSLGSDPVVSTLMGAAYLAWQSPLAPMVLNVICVGLTAGLLFVVMRRLKLHALMAMLAIVLWLAYPPHWREMGYYSAGPIIALLSAVTLLAIVDVIQRRHAVSAAFAGAMAGLLVLASPAYILGAVVMGALAALRAGMDERPAVARVAGAFAIGLIVVAGSWVGGNAYRHGAITLLNTRDAQLLYEGTQGVSSVPAPVDRERRDSMSSEMAANHALIAGAVDAWKESPAAQRQRVARRATAFWAHVPEGSNAPSGPTAMVALICLPLAAVTLLLRPKDAWSQLIGAWLVAIWLAHGLWHAELRYNFGLLPLLIAMALTGAQALVELIRPFDVARMRRPRVTITGPNQEPTFPLEVLSRSKLR